MKHRTHPRILSVLFALTVASALFLVPAAIAQPGFGGGPGGGPGGGHFGGHHGGHHGHWGMGGFLGGFGPGPMHHLGALDLTDAQRDTIEGIFDTHRDDLRAGFDVMREIRTELATATDPESFDETAARALMPRLATAEADLASTRAVMFQEIQGVLTDEQRATLAALREERQANRELRREERGDRPGRRGGRFGRGPGGPGLGDGPCADGPCGGFGGPMGRMGFLAERLGLDAAQQEAVQALFTAHHETASTQRQATFDAHRELMAQIHAETVDEIALQAAADTLAASQVEMAILHGQAMIQFRALLTPEQIELLDEMGDRRAGRRGGRRGF